MTTKSPGPHLNSPGPHDETRDGEEIDNTQSDKDERLSRKSSNLDLNQNDTSSSQKELKRQNSQDVKIGNRKATLFLSSHSLKKSIPGQKSPTKIVTNSKSNTPDIPSPIPPSRKASGAKKKDRVIPDELKLLKVQKEFTFTGYDIMADVEPKEELEGLELEIHTYQQNYLYSCKKVGVIPVTSISKQIGGPEMSIRSHSLGPVGTRAISVVLVGNKLVTSLDLEDNGIGSEGAAAIGEMIQENTFITYLSLAENLIGTDGLRAICEGLKQNQTIQTIDLTGSGFVDSDANIIAEIVENNTTLREIILSHNNFCEKGGVIIAAAIAINDYIRILDLSWNHLRGKGAMAIGAMIQKNIGLRRLDLSWNGYAKDECYILGKAMKENTTLKELDISNNRINTEAVGFIMDGIKINDGLEILRLGGNPITPDVALVIVKVIQQTDHCRISQLDLSDIDVEEEFLTVVDEIQGFREFRVLHGSVLKHGNNKKDSSDGIDGNLDAVAELYKYMSDNNYRVIDLMKWLDKDGSMSVSRAEFKKGMLTAEVPITEHQLDKMLDKLDMDGDGEVDFSELLVGERAYRRKMRAKKAKMSLSRAKPDKLDRIVLAKIDEFT